MTVSIIVAVAQNGVIGREGQLPWRLSSDLRRFKQITMGHHLVMGRRTFESIGRLLPGRTSVVITRRESYEAPGAVVVFGFEQALSACAGDDEVFVIGGAEIYRLALPSADRVYLTQIHANVPGDVRFDELNALGPPDWRVVQQEPSEANEGDEFAYTFRILERATNDLPT